MQKHFRLYNLAITLFYSIILLSAPMLGHGADFELAYTTEAKKITNPDFVKNTDLFKQANSQALNFQNNSDAIWIQVAIDELSSEKYLVFDNASIDTIDFYQYVDGELVSFLHTGDNYNFSEREVESTRFIFPLTQSRSPSEIYIRIRSRDILFVPISVESQEELYKKETTFGLVKGLYYGIILVMFMYNILIAFFTKDSNYFTYSGYVLFIGLAQSTLDGTAFRYVFPYTPVFYNYSFILFPSVAGVLAVLFGINFLKVKTYAKKWLFGMYVFLGAYAASFFLVLLGFKEISNNILNACGATVGIYGLAMAFVISRKGYRPANFFILAWSLFLVALIIFVLRVFGVVDTNVFTENVLNLGNAIQIILLSVALADSINVLRREKEKSQAEALKVSRENEQIIREQNLTLEQKVTERTFELQEANEELTVTLANLRDAQTQLVDAEKMASLGQLTAGIAHEINNPINFVTSNITPLKRDLDEMYELVDAYSSVTEESIHKLQEAHELKEELDYDYLKTEIVSLVDGISDGASRTSEIVRGLRTFSRLDEDALKIASIQEGIASTLVLLRSKMADTVEVIQDYDSDVPEIECFPGKLNQVFMNILNNGIYAVTHKTYQEPEKAAITIRTKLNKNTVDIHLADNGIGMDEPTKKKMFDPFFTTKDVGEGTGLGMAIVYKIIEKHGGSLIVETELNKGTEFIITLPLRQPNEFE